MREAVRKGVKEGGREGGRERGREGRRERELGGSTLLDIHRGPSEAWTLSAAMRELRKGPAEKGLRQQN